MRSCWTGNNRRVGGTDAPHLVVDPEARVVGLLGPLGVARIEADVDIKVDIVSAAEGTKGANVMSDDISSRWRGLPNFQVPTRRLAG